MAAAQGILLSCAKEKLVEFGEHIDLNRHWAFSLLKNEFCETKSHNVKKQVLH